MLNMVEITHICGSIAMSIMVKCPVLMCHKPWVFWPQITHVKEPENH